MDMRRFEQLHDQYIWGMCESKEPDIISECAVCGTELYEGQEIVTDGEYHFCDKECAIGYYEVEELEVVPKGTVCAVCGEELTPEYEAYTDIEGEFFCSQECAETFHELKWVELEGEE